MAIRHGLFRLIEPARRDDTVRVAFDRYLRFAGHEVVRLGSSDRATMVHACAIVVPPFRGSRRDNVHQGLFHRWL